MTPNFEYPVFWHLKDDGAPARCKECGEYDNMKNLLYYKTPNGNVGVIHKDCLDPDWLESAKDLGDFPY